MYDGSHFVREQEFTKSVGRGAGMASLCHITVGVIFTDMKRSVPFNNHNHFVWHCIQSPIIFLSSYFSQGPGFCGLGL